MVYLLILFLIIFLFPVLLLPFFLFMLLMVIFIPYKFTFDSLLILFMAPQQIIKIAINPVLRRNHALEHATINVIEEAYGPQQLSGLAKEDGFYIKGALKPAVIREAAEEGLRRLKSGEGDLVVHKRCGTSLAVANLLSAIIFLFLLFQTGNFTIIYVFVAILFSNLLGPVLGKYVQKLFTTSTDVEGMVIEDVYYENNSRNILGLMSIKQSQKLFIKTDKLRVY
jgi:hypothetical protein